MSVVVVHRMPQQGVIPHRSVRVHQEAAAVQVLLLAAVAEQVVQAGVIKS